MNSIKFSSGYIEQTEKLNQIKLNDLDASEKSVKLANRWLNMNINFAEAITAATEFAANCRWAAVSRLKQGTSKVDILALIDNSVFVDCFTYDFNQTPCEEILGDFNQTPCEEILGRDKFCHFREVQHSFPEDEELTLMGVADYAGCAFKDSLGQVAGHIFVMHDQPMENILEIENVITTMVSMIQLEWPE